MGLDDWCIGGAHVWNGIRPLGHSGWTTCSCKSAKRTKIDCRRPWACVRSNSIPFASQPMVGEVFVAVFAAAVKRQCRLRWAKALPGTTSAQSIAKIHWPAAVPAKTSPSPATLESKPCGGISVGRRPAPELPRAKAAGVAAPATCRQTGRCRRGFPRLLQVASAALAPGESWEPYFCSQGIF